MSGSEYFNVPIFFILFRETTEAAIIISVLLTFLKQILVDDHANKKKLIIQVWAGTAIGLTISIAIGVAFIVVWNKYSRNLWAESEGIWEGSFSLLATVMITVMAIAMLRTNHIQEKWKVKLAKALEHRDKKGIRYSTRKYAFFLLPLLTLLREGLEAIVFIGGVTFDARGKSIPIAVCAGVIAGIAVGFLMYRGGNMLNLFWFFTISTCVLLLVAAGLFVRGIAAFEANTWGKKTGAQSDDDGTYDPRVNVWALNCCDQNDPNEAGWQFFNALLGWSNVASVGTIVGYCCYWLGVIAVLMSLKVRHRRSVLKESQLNQNLESVDADGPLMVDGVKAELDDTVDGECPPMEVVAKGNIKIEIDTS